MSIEIFRFCGERSNFLKAFEAFHRLFEVLGQAIMCISDWIPFLVRSILPLFPSLFLSLFFRRSKLKMKARRNVVAKSRA
jgi:hypothetical protein